MHLIDPTTTCGCNVSTATEGDDNVDEDENIKKHQVVSDSSITDDRQTNKKNADVQSAQRKAIEKLQRVLIAGTSSSPSVSDSQFQVESLCEVIKSTKALIAINAEIWDRCQPHKFTSKTQTATTLGTVDDSFHGEGACCGNQQLLKFWRIIYDRVIVKNCYDAKVKQPMYDIQTTSTFEIKDFGKLPTIPNELTSIVSFSNDDCMLLFANNKKEQGEEEMILLFGYEAIFDKAFLLHDDVLLLFLVKFKEYLKSVQVFLGRIDQWILDVESNTETLRSIFVGFDEQNAPSRLRWKDVTDQLCFMEGPPNEEINPNSSCLTCQKPFSQHSMRVGQRGHWRYERYQCPMSSNQHKEQHSACSWYHGEFVQPLTSSLKRLISTGLHHQEFSLNSKLDVVLLTNFVNFATRQEELLIDMKKTRRLD